MFKSLWVKNWLKDNYGMIILFFGAIIFFFLYSFLSFSTPLKFNSPDETANYFFIKLFVEKGELRYFEPLNLISENIIHPRSINVFNGFLVPGGFLGIILIYGSIAKIFNLGIVLYLTPLFSVITVLFFYSLIKRIFDNKIAFISSILFFLHPTIFYYSSRGLFNNVLFLDLLIIGFYFLLEAVLRWNKRRLTPIIKIILAGLFIGLALIVRTSEVTWVGAILLFLLFIYYREIKWQQIFIFVATIILIFIPVFYYNQILYNHPFYSGYQELKSNLTVPKSILTNFKKFILPFGFSFSRIWNNIYHYLIQIFWWLFIPLVLGLGIEIKRLWAKKREFKKIDSKTKNQLIFLLIFIFISLYLAIYYGSWTTYDNITPGRITIGNSHLRYWLPIYILSLPFISLFLIKIANIFKKRYLGYSLTLFFCFLIIYFSFYSVLWGGEESLAAVRRNILEYKTKGEIVFRLTEPNSIIITLRQDKIFFPERKIITLLDNPTTLKNLSRLIKEVPIYYYTFETEEDLNHLDKKLKNYNLRLTDEVIIGGREKILKVKEL